MANKVKRRNLVMMFQLLMAVVVSIGRKIEGILIGNYDADGISASSRRYTFAVKDAVTPDSADLTRWQCGRKIATHPRVLEAINIQARNWQAAIRSQIKTIRIRLACVWDLCAEKANKPIIADKGMNYQTSLLKSHVGQVRLPATREYDTNHRLSASDRISDSYGQIAKWVWQAKLRQFDG